MWAAQEPVADVDVVDDQPWLEHDRVGDHRVVVGVGVLGDVEVLLHLAAGVGQEGPVGADQSRNSLVLRMLSVQMVTIWQ